MMEKISQHNYVKKEDQEHFFNDSHYHKDKIIGDAKIEAELMKGFIERNISSDTFDISKGCCDHDSAQMEFELASHQTDVRLNDAVAIARIMHDMSVDPSNNKEVVAFDQKRVVADTVKHYLKSNEPYLASIAINNPNYAAVLENLHEPQLTDAASDGYMVCLLHGWTMSASRIKEDFSLTADDLEKIKPIIREHLKERLEKDDLNVVIQIIRSASSDFSIEELSTPEITAVALDKFKRYLSSRRYGSIRIEAAQKISEQFPISSNDIDVAVLDQFSAEITRGKVDEAIEINKYYPISSQKLEQAVFAGMQANLSRGDFDKVVGIKNNFSISPEHLASEELEKAAHEGITVSLSRGDLGEALKIKKNFPISPENLEQAVCEGLRENLSHGDIHNSREIKKVFSISPEHLASAELRQAAYEGIKANLSRGDFGKVIEIKNIFSIEPVRWRQTIPHIIDHILQDERYGDELEEVKKFISANAYSFVDILPQLQKKSQHILQSLRSFDSVSTEQIISFEQAFERSPSLQIFIYQNDALFIRDMIQGSPFLLDAIVRNESFGPRLFVAYGGFDRSSQDKVKMIFQWQKEILVQNPDMKSGSVEYRRAMQEKMKTYMMNPDILIELEKIGISVDEWLTYDERITFELGMEKDEDISILKMIERPFNRIISETIPAYIGIIKEEFAPYKNELDKLMVPHPKVRELQKKLMQMKKMYDETVDEQKKMSMEKGIANMEKTLSGLQDVSYVDHLRGAVSGLKNMIKMIKNGTEELQKSEQDRKYQKIIETKKKLYLDYKTLCVRFDLFQKDLNEVLDTHFAVHGEAIKQVIHHQTAEMLHHFTTDHQDLIRVFENAQSDEQLKKSKVVSLELWHRNPDIDLYLGNYSPCCISIEGGTGLDQSESAIADFMTDVSIQVLNLVDQEKNVPIMSAWLYIGKNNLGETALIIDNIESNVSQTDLYHDDIWEKVRKYVITYAQKIGVQKVVMGRSNNDIEPKSVPKSVEYDENTYIKAGPVNGNRLKGYYLESEMDATGLYVIWTKPKEKSDFYDHN